MRNRGGIANGKRRALLALALLGAAVVLPATSQAEQRRAQPANALYKDASRPIPARVEDLLKRMTLEEKVAQMVTIWEHKDRIQTPAGDFSGQGVCRVPQWPRPDRAAL